MARDKMAYWPKQLTSGPEGWIESMLDVVDATIEYLRNEEPYARNDIAILEEARNILAMWQEE